MRNNKGAFFRTDEVSREPDQCPDWLDLFAAKLRIDESVKIASAKTAVEVARERKSGPSIYEMMSSIVSGQKPKYSSVEEAVKDYQRRTGLEEYLKRAGDNDLSVLASQIISSAAHGVCSKCGNSYSECECDKDDWHPSDLESDEERLESQLKFNKERGWDDDEEPIDEEDEDLDAYNSNRGRKKDWRDFFDVDPNDPDISDEERNERNEKLLEREFSDARDMTEEELLANPGKKKLISEANEEKPEILKKNPAIESFLNNIIDTNYGIQVPAILHSLIETFGRDGIDFTVFSDRDLLDWINNRLISKGITTHETSSHLGRGVGTQIDYTGERDSNRDPFTLLVPNKGNF